MTFATTSSFLSSAVAGAPFLPFVRAASLSVAVAPKHRAKSMVEDCVQTVRLDQKDIRDHAHVLPP